MHICYRLHRFILAVCVLAVAPISGQIFDSSFTKNESRTTSSSSLRSVSKSTFNSTWGNSQNTVLDKRTFGSITQNFLDSVREISKNAKGGFYKVDLSIDWNHTEGRQCIYVKRGNQQLGRLEGRLIAVDQEGIYLYNSVNDIFRYVHFNNIKFIRRGRTWEKKIVRDALVGAAAGAVIGGLASLYDDPLEYFLVYGLVGASVGGIIVPIYTFIPEVLVHLIQNINPQIKSKIEYNKVQMGYYVQMVNQDRMRYGNRILYSDFPRISEMKPSPSPVLANTNVSRRKDTLLVNLQDSVVVSPEPVRDGVGFIQKEIKTSPEKELNKAQSKLQTKGGNQRTAAFKEGKFISAAWMYEGYNPKAVDVNRMLRMFPDLRFSRLTGTESQVFRNKDEVRYAAMSICTQIGYDFTKVVVFSESQELDLTQSLPFYNVQIVQEGTVINSRALTQTDEFNLRFLYDLMLGMEE